MSAPVACKTAMYHDLMRTLKDKPFVLMESSPGQTCWQPTSKLKKTGMHILSSLQAVAHGADAVQYFQWRKSRGGIEKFHGSVIDHVGHLNTRTGREVSQLGEMLAALSSVVGTKTQARVAIIFDWGKPLGGERCGGARATAAFTMNKRWLITTVHSGSRALPSM
ncbi:Beta-galactosidase BglY [Kluyvera cryocrescens]|uniref:Beta-galactosidase BglY n=1 Tax=Kluyvera cryocrescens TaxID=580 RepID=A0A485D4R0_KLUCR|nr:Beta-galactosidase BglY [Kluyvera cryocrescens]